jgi:phosphodiesterase/alkaline phosphatase D-like protein
VTQTSAVLWTRAVETGRLTLQIATDPSFHHVAKAKKLTVTDPLVPVKIEVDHLKAGTQYYYRFIDASGDVIEGRFETANKTGTHDGFHFGVITDAHGTALAPNVALNNAAAMNLDLVIKMGDMIFADQPPPGDMTLAEFRADYIDLYSSHLGLNYLDDLQASTSILALPNDAELGNNYAGGASPSSDPRFAGQSGDFINETPLYANAMQAFREFNAIDERTYHHTGDDRFDGAPDFYRYNTYGSDASIIMLDTRSFKDAEIPGPVNPLNPAEVIPFLAAAFTPGRTTLGSTQLERLKQDLLDARDKGMTWKFVMLGEPIQNSGPILEPGDRWEGFAAERAQLLKFIDDNHIHNVVFVTGDAHVLSVNNLTYQEHFGGPQIASSAFEVVVPSLGGFLFGPAIPPAAATLGLISAAQLAFYNGLPNAPDTDNIPNDKDDFVESILNTVLAGLGYDPIGLDNNLAVAAGKINATLLQGDYFVTHDFGWSDFNIDPVTGQLMVTTWGVPEYTAADLATNPAAVLALNPAIVSQFVVTPSSDSIIGTARNDRLGGTNDDDVILGAAGNDKLNGRDGNDYLDGGRDNDEVRGGDGNDRIFGRDGRDELKGEDGDDLIFGGAGDDELKGGSGNDILDGGFGDDELTGGWGNDTFRFADDLDAHNNVDEVIDFSVADDTIELENDVFTALAAGPLAAGNFVVGAKAADANDFIIYNPHTGALFYDADGNGPGEQIKFAGLDDSLALTYNDFLVV